MSSPVRPIAYDNLRQLLAPRARDSHKGAFGHVLIAGGAPGFAGAPLMAAEAANRTGAGLTSVATHPDHAAAFLCRRPELMVHAVHNFDVINAMTSQTTVLVAGPGLGRSGWSVQLLQTVMRAASTRELPVVLDADGLNLLSEGQLAFYLEGKLEGKCQWILTPHPGEAARLLQTQTEEVQANREEAVRELQRRFGGVAILKGAGTLICFDQQGRQQVETCVHGNPGMASGGMGDVLSGIIGGLLAQGLSLADSARLGVCLHSKAGDLCADHDGERGMLACDLFPYLRTLLNP